MRNRLLTAAFYLLGPLLLPPLISHGVEKGTDGEEVKMQYVPLDWVTLKDLITPADEFSALTDYIPLPNPRNAQGFPCTAERNVVKLDMDGDGVTETELKERNNLVQYTLTYQNGVKSSYQLRVWRADIEATPDGGVAQWRWCYQRAGFMRGQIQNETVILIDDNNNGRYNDYGADAISVGAGNKCAGWLAPLIMLKDKIYELKVDETGLKVWAKEYQGPTGTINLLKGLNFPNYSPAVVRLQCGATLSFITIFPGKKPSIVPVGNYAFVMALFDKRLRARKDALVSTIKVEANKETVLKWGKPFKLEPNPYYDKGGDLVIFTGPGQFQPPTLTFKRLDCPFIKMDDLPLVIGAHEEEYFCLPEPKDVKDSKGNCFPDAAVGGFDMAIIAKKPAPGAKAPQGKVLNRFGNSHVDKWIPINLSGLIEGRQPYWISYGCPLYEYRGLVTVKVSAKSSMFGDLAFEEDVEVGE